MSPRWKYWGAAAAGTVGLSLIAVFVAGVLTDTPVTVADGFVRTMALAGGVVGIALTPLYVSRPRPATRLVTKTGQQVGLASLVLVGLNAVGVPGAPTASTTLVAGALLALALPAWYHVCRRRLSPHGVLIVGDDPVLIKSAIYSLPTVPIGFLSPVLTERGIETAPLGEPGTETDPVIATDGGRQLENRIELIAGIERLGNPARLKQELREHDVDTVSLAFADADREACFGALRTCREYGIGALVHESLADAVLDGERVGDSLVRVDLEPWPWYSRLLKRAFDIVFATVGLLVLAPLVAVIAVAIKLDSPGPVLYNQTRTSTLGETFTLAKFRSMVTDAEAEGVQLSQEDAGGVDPRITTVGKVLRKTHLDEIPQLLSILRGEMSVVGPRPERPEIDRELEAEGLDWSKRWFVKPGLTGIAQVNDVTGFDPEQKLAYDLEYARRRSLRLDATLVAVQIWSVVTDVFELVSAWVSREPDDESSST
jgi:lipopolysaccharide/colanic/teichoic acid biosynthesis glycosyltransferase